MKNSFKRVLAVALSAAMVLTAAPLASTTVNAAKKVKLSASKGTITVGKTKKVTIKNTKKSNIKSVKFTYSNTKKRVTVKRSGLTIKITGKKAGTVTVTAKITLKKAVAGKKTYKLKYKATVKKAATPTPVEVKTTAITLDKNTATVMAGDSVTLAATLTPADSTEAIEWSSDKPEIATVAAGVVTGVAEGQAVITAKSGECSATCAVTVTKKEVVAKLTDAKQTKANEIQLTFDIDARSLVNKDDIAVGRADGTLSTPVNAIAFSEDGLTAKITLAQSLSDGVEYKVAYKGAEQSFTASVGEVYSVSITTASAEQNVDTKIEYALLDAKGVDVTSSVRLADTVRVEVSGSSATANTADPAKATIQFNNIGDTATVTVTYNSNKEGAKDISATQTVTCIAPKAVVGEKVFAYTNWTNARSNCAKFYRGLSDTTVTIEEGSNTNSLGGTDDVYFYAKADDGSAISYDSYAVESSNDDVASANVVKDTGKYARINVVANKVGTANINVKATKNGADTFYTIPVKVVKVGVLDSIKISNDKTTISNANESDYFGKIEVTAFDNNGEEITGNDDVTYSFEIVDADKYAGQTAPGVAGLAGFGKTDGAFGKNTTKITAPGAAQHAFTITVSVSQGDKTITRSTTVTVRPLPAAAWDSAQGSAMTYSVELANTTIDASRPLGTPSRTTARLAATTGGVFAGYVNADGTVGDDTADDDGISNACANAASKIDATGGAGGPDGLRVAVKYGNRYSINGLLYESATNVQVEDYVATGASKQGTLVIESRRGVAAGIDPAEYYVSGDISNDKYFAKTGSYTVSFTYRLQNDTKNTTKNASLTVKNSIYVPTVTVASRTVSGAAPASVAEALVVSVDLNNDTSVSDSVVAVSQSFKNNVNTAAAVNAAGTQVQVKYVGVLEDGIWIYVPAGGAFTIG